MGEDWQEFSVGTIGIKADDGFPDRLVENLCTIWIGRYHLYANSVRFERPHKSFSAPTANAANAEVPKRSFAPQHSMPACLMRMWLMVRPQVKDFTAIPRLYTILKDEGFLDVKLNYLGGTWVLFEFCNIDTKVNFMNHTGINSWFQVIQDAIRLVVKANCPGWIIDGIPLRATGPRETFKKIWERKYGERWICEDNVVYFFGRKRLCVKTAHPVSILETFKIIVKGRVFMVRAKELFTWNPSFIDNKEKDYVSEEESDFVPNNNESNHHINEEVFGDVYGSDDDGVPETVFGSNTSSPNQVVETFFVHPPGFTPEGVVHHEKMGTANGEADNNGGKDNSVTFSARVMNNSQDIPEEMHILTALNRFIGPILLREVHLDFGPIPFRFYHSWFDFVGFDDMIKLSWASLDYSNIDGMTHFKKKLQDLKVIIHRWVKTKRLEMVGSKLDTIAELEKIDKAMDIGVVDDSIVLRRLELKNNLLKLTEMEAKDRIQKSKVKWAVEGDENSKFFHGIINKRRSQLAIRGVFVDGIWRSDPVRIKNAFFDHFEARFKKPADQRFKLNFQFHKILLKDQADDLERGVSRDEIRRAVWNCGDNKSPGPDGFTFEFLKKYWDVVGSDFCEAIEHFFHIWWFLQRLQLIFRDSHSEDYRRQIR
ncbi:hypothetical protein Tco_0222747 [Tanacetum coccineum]